MIYHLNQSAHKGLDGLDPTNLCESFDVDCPSSEDYQCFVLPCEVATSSPYDLKERYQLRKGHLCPQEEREQHKSLTQVSEDSTKSGIETCSKSSKTRIVRNTWSLCDLLKRKSKIYVALSSLLTRYLQCPMVQEQKNRNDNETSVPVLRLKPCFLASKV
ncbi:jg15253 [Pararge aegeria aegeria]|uniref:Jg15253 protein n=1 Tax=Pararge aegeria aegeria TaxID=348720 RepID=A0A8S4SG96_9NEOP|nr:jg15253 [Pararge aegeria aegeria]